MDIKSPTTEETVQRKGITWYHRCVTNNNIEFFRQYNVIWYKGMFLWNEQCIFLCLFLDVRKSDNKDVGNSYTEQQTPEQVSQSQ